jgi:hypothetical protein
VAGEGWIRMLSFIPYLSSPASGSPLGTVLRARTARRVPALGATYLPCCTTASKSQCTKHRKVAQERMLAPPASSQPLPGWARGPLSVP